MTYYVFQKYRASLRRAVLCYHLFICGLTERCNSLLACLKRWYILCRYIVMLNLSLAFCITNAYFKRFLNKMKSFSSCNSNISKIIRMKYSLPLFALRLMHKGY